LVRIEGIALAGEVAERENKLVEECSYKFAVIRE
jgi:hypothetical protein